MLHLRGKLIKSEGECVMGFEGSIKDLVEKISNEKQYTNNEQATKVAFINPFLDSLGYDVRDPRKVQHEYSSDAGGKKGEKVDYAIMKDDTPIMIIEAKHHGEKLDGWGTQLQRYFNVMSDVKFAILTNGVEYKFFTDFDELNMLDKTPFMHINLEDIDKSSLQQLEKFAYDNLDLETAYENAAFQKYVMQVTEVLKSNFDEPSDAFIDFFAKSIDLGQKRVTARIKEEMKLPVKKSLDDFINNKVRRALNQSLNSIDSRAKRDDTLDEENASGTANEDTPRMDEFSYDEDQGFRIICAILAEKASVEDTVLKNTIHYATVLMYGKTTRWVARMRFKGSAKTVEYNAPSVAGQRFSVDAISDIYKHKAYVLEALENVAD